ncbi:MAG: response regulator [Candidatus Hermodarchaeota archaeon]
MVNIFIVEDDMSTMFLFQKYLELNGLKIVASAKNGIEAINMYNTLSPKPDLILMDYQMPGINGADTTKEILKIDNNAKIIIMSSDKSAKNNALSAGAVSFREKSLPFSSFINDIKRDICKILCPKGVS